MQSPSVILWIAKMFRPLYEDLFISGYTLREISIEGRYKSWKVYFLTGNISKIKAKDIQI